MDSGPILSALWLVPFCLLLLCIALVPLIDAHFWEKHLWWISLGVFTLPMIGALLIFLGIDYLSHIVHAMREYASFILLLASLYVISGGILIRGSFRGTPITNTIFLLIGSLLASIIGTTGASMLLIRPLLRANAGRKRNAHVVVFFIFVVSNLGGLLTPLGDPPLFLGYLQGVPFLWTMQLVREWVVANSIVILIFYLVDRMILKQDGSGVHLHEKDELEKFHITGWSQFALLGGVISAIYLQGFFLQNVRDWPHFGPQETMMLILMIVSLLIMPVKHSIRLQNGFSFKPIMEVVFLFAGIFATMLPALQFLQQHATSLGVSKPWQFFWFTGILSSFLDNAPTYLTFLSIAKGLGLSGTDGIHLHDGSFIASEILAAISCGAVFMGANSYIGNGPNFMVRAIADERGVKMPGFFGYMVYSGVVLIPVFVLISWLFF